MLTWELVLFITPTAVRNSVLPAEEKVERLSETTKFPLTSFNRCQICGKEDDICCFRMHYEFNDDDSQDFSHILVVCNTSVCTQVLKDHPRLYSEVSWGKGHPGIFMLLCGSCPSRKGTSCTHPSLKENGGAGLQVNFAKFPWSGFTCGEAGCRPLLPLPSPAVSCEGHPAKKPRT